MNSTKELILNHPLFPLLTIVFHKCELATIAPYALDSFNKDIIEFIKQLNKEHFRHYVSNDEIDDFMIQVIQVLRFHLLEMDKVHELCDNFCQRYIDLLKDKMRLDFPSENYKSDDEEEDDDDDEVEAEHLRTKEVIKPFRSLSESSENFERDAYNQPVRVPFRQKKRGIFPKSATSLMRTWLFQHLNHPYPSEEEKQFLAQETNLSIIQVNNWFINARRRILQPMVDQSNRAAAMMGTEYHDLMINSSYPVTDRDHILHTISPNTFNDMAAAYYPSLDQSSAYLSTSTSSDQRSISLPIQYEVLP
ncbi:unnamed protein product [Adineta ricciae]|uniref:Homeobox domain-containing protein n=1 Tax=Adineta ricciae TaxID=249248 RepID=A0A814K6F1_ADIRI|nr:unnamed protein product [Adineta ricciae]CAF1565643.1 unnamed protein product [Adineta ricciae]